MKPLATQGQFSRGPCLTNAAILHAPSILEEQLYSTSLKVAHPAGLGNPLQMAGE